MLARPRISIVTPVLNRARMLPAALASLSEQGTEAVEHLVVDGGSSDNSIDVARRSGATVIEAPGTSIYEAINIGLERARGEIIGLLNSDDRFATEAFTSVLAHFREHPSTDMVMGDAALEGTAAQWVQNRARADAGCDVDLPDVLSGPTNINACFFRAHLLSAIGPFDTTYRIAADREWLIRALLSGAKILRIQATTYIYLSHADSLTIGRNKPARQIWVREHIQMARHLLSQAQLTSHQRHALQIFFAKENAHLLSLLMLRPQDAFNSFVSGLRVDPLWPLRAIKPTTDIVSRRLKLHW